jgi:hypothetical protein
MTAKKSFLLRVDPALWAEVERLAQADLRSVNAQVEFMLRDNLRQRGRIPRQVPAKASEGGEDE